MIGKTQTVLVEKFNPKTHMAKGYGQHYIPVEFPSDAGQHNRFLTVSLDSLGSGSDPVLKGTIVLQE
jgi:threonylcarbamoyladenosine tRNA methylthiotransferase MtaB